MGSPGYAAAIHIFELCVFLEAICSLQDTYAPCGFPRPHGILDFVGSLSGGKRLRTLHAAKKATAPKGIMKEKGPSPVFAGPDRTRHPAMCRMLRRVPPMAASNGLTIKQDWTQSALHGRGRGGGPALCGHSWWPCGHGSHAPLRAGASWAGTFSRKKPFPLHSPLAIKRLLDKD